MGAQVAGIDKLSDLSKLLMGEDGSTVVLRFRRPVDLSLFHVTLVRAENFTGNGGPPCTCLLRPVACRMRLVCTARWPGTRPPGTHRPASVSDTGC
jgi:hypothetical protein